MLTVKTYLTKKRFKEEVIVEVERILGLFWRHNMSPEDARSSLMDLLKISAYVDKVEHLYAKNNTAYDPVNRTLRLKDDPLWPKIEKDVELIKKGECPYCHSSLESLTVDRQFCRACDKFYLFGKL